MPAAPASTSTCAHRSGGARALVVGTVGLAAMLVSGLASAQESHKFNAKTLESAYELPVFSSKGGVVGSEVVENTNEELHTRSAVYSVRTEIKKVLDFYGAALGDPKKSSDGTDVTYTFKKNDKRFGRKVLLRYDSASRSVEITLVVKEWQSEDDIEQ